MSIPSARCLCPGFLAVVGGPIFGWAKPVPVLKNRLDNPRFGMMAVAAAGPLTNFLLAIVAAIALGMTLPLGAGMSEGGTGMSTIIGLDGEVAPIATGMFYFLLINVFLGMFNLLPIPPFDGSHIVEGAMPRRWVKYYEKLRPFGMALFVGLIAVTWFAPGLGVLENTIGPPVNWALGQYLALAEMFAGS